MTTEVVQARPANPKRQHIILAASLVAIVLAMLLIPSSNPLTSNNDFVAYWSAARQFVHRGNPYDYDAVLQIEREIDVNRTSPLVMRNPPWALPFVAPLGYLQLRVARSVWLLAALVAVLVSLLALSRLYLPRGRRWLGVLTSALFLPVMIAITIGQTSPFLLLGVSGLLYFADRRRYVQGGRFDVSARL